MDFPPSASFVRPFGTATRIQIWTSGLAGSGRQSFAPTAFDRTVGAKLQPFQGLDLRFGTELVRSGDLTRSVSSRANWEATWSRSWERFGGLKIGLVTIGSVDNLQAGYSQSFGGTVRIPLRPSVDPWSTEFRLSPNLNFDTSNGTIGTRLMSELVSRRVLSSRNDAFRSVLNVKLGYGMAPDAPPFASAQVEVRISPNL